MKTVRDPFARLAALVFPAKARALCVLPLLAMSFPAITAHAQGMPPAHVHAQASTAASPSPDQTQPQAAKQTLAPQTASGGRVAASTPQSVAASGNAILSREVFGYATSGSLGDPSFGYPSWNFDLLTTVAFFSIHVDPSGVLVADSAWNVWNSSTLTGLVNTAHAHGVKVVVTIRNPPDMCGALFNSDTTTLQIMREVVAKGIDGINIDYEGQLVLCPSLFPEQTSQQMLTTFAQRLRTALDNQRAGYYLSIATYSGSASGPDGFFNIPALNPYVDSFFVMAYDMDYANQGSAPLTCSSFCLAPMSPLANYYWNDTTSMSQYSAVVGSRKVILGQPYYGRVACVANPTAHAVATSSVSAATYLDSAAAITSSDVRPGSYSINRDGDDPAGMDRWDAWWDNRLGCWREMYWADTTTLGVRYNLVNQANLRGVGFWTLNYGGGAPELWNTLNTYFVKCASASVSPGTVSQGAGSLITMTAAATQCNAPSYEFWVQFPNGAWQLVQGWGGPTFNWDTTGLAPGTYTIHAWAHALGWGYDTIGSATVTLTPCATAAIDPASSTQAQGAIVPFTATSTGCPKPRYAFWVQYPDASWHFVQNFGGATFNWNTTGLLPGAYKVNAWVNTLGNSYDAVASATVTLTGCSAAALSPAAPTQPAGTTFSFTGSSTGCVARYAFWVQYPNGSWYFLQNFGLPDFKWNTAGLAPGTYNIHVWVNNQGNGYDSVGSATATLTGCTASALAPASGSSAAGTTITFTASATGCPNPTYELWLQDPGGNWHFMRTYSTATTWSWNSAGWAKGNYTIHVWANQQGASLNTYETIGSATYTLT
jgi:spore germination protein YaaH